MIMGCGDELCTIIPTLVWRLFGTAIPLNITLLILYIIAFTENYYPKYRNGIGKTGTFICIYAQLERLKAEGIVDIFQSVKASRLQRSLMVTTTVS